MSDVRVRYVAEISNLLGGMQTLSGATNKQIAELNRASRALSAYDAAQRTTATTAAGKLAPSLGAARGAAQNLQAQIFDIAQQLQAGTNPLTILSQQGPQVAQALGQAGGGAAALVSALTPLAAAAAAVTVAATAGYAAWAIYTGEMRQAEQQAKTLATMLAIVAPVTDEITDLELQAALAKGELTKEEYSYERSVRSAAAALDEQKKKTLEQFGVTQAQVEAVQMLADGTGRYTGALAGLSDKQRTAATTVNALQTAYERKVEILGEVRDAQTAQRLATEAASAATKRHKDTTDEDEAAIRRQTEAYTALLRAQLAAQTDAAAIVSRLTEARLGEFERLDLAEQESASRLIATGQSTADQLYAIQVEYNRRRADLADKWAEDAEKRREEEAEAARELADLQVSYVANQAAAVGAIADEIASRGGDAAKFAAGVAKASAIFQIGVDTAAAVVKGMAIFGPPPSPAGIVAVGSALTIGAAQAALVASEPLPEFHTGGEVTAKLLPGEFVVNQQGVSTAGKEQLRDMNAGIAPSSEVYAVSIYRHTRMVERWKRDGLSAGDPIVKRIDSGRILGHRTDRG